MSEIQTMIILVEIWSILWDMVVDLLDSLLFSWIFNGQLLLFEKKICQNCGVSKATNSVVGEAINDIDILAEVIEIKWALLHVWPSLLLCPILNPLSHFIIKVGVPIEIIALHGNVNYAGDTYTGDYLS